MFLSLGAFGAGPDQLLNLSMFLCSGWLIALVMGWERLGRMAGSFLIFRMTAGCIPFWTRYLGAKSLDDDVAQPPRRHRWKVAGAESVPQQVLAGHARRPEFKQPNRLREKPKACLKLSGVMSGRHGRSVK